MPKCSCGKDLEFVYNKHIEELQLALIIANSDFNKLREYCGGYVPLNNNGRWLSIARKTLENI